MRGACATGYTKIDRLIITLFSPSQTQIASVSITALAEMISLVKSAHKYEMDDWVHWGLQVLTRLLEDLNSLPAEHLQALHSLYNL